MQQQYVITTTNWNRPTTAPTTVPTSSDTFNAKLQSLRIGKSDELYITVDDKDNIEKVYVVRELKVDEECERNDE